MWGWMQEKKKIKCLWQKSTCLRISLAGQSREWLGLPRYHIKPDVNDVAERFTIEKEAYKYINKIDTFEASTKMNEIWA